jgi:hypothetical protein
MGASGKVRYTWEGSATFLDRLAKANERADAAWLRSLSLEESALILEDLCRGIPEVPVASDEDPPPVVLCRIWRFQGLPAPTAGGAHEIARGTGKFGVPGKLEDLIHGARP